MLWVVPNPVNLVVAASITSVCTDGHVMPSCWAVGGLPGQAVAAWCLVCCIIVSLTNATGAGRQWYAVALA